MNAWVLVDNFGRKNRSKEFINWFFVYDDTRIFEIIDPMEESK